MIEREVYIRELSNNYYYTSPYFISKVIFDILPLRVIPPILIVSISYFWAGLHQTAGRFFWNMFFMVLFNIGSGALCILVGSVSSGVGSANITTILIIIFFILFAGFPANRQSLSPVVRWLTFVSFWSYPLEGVVVNEFTGTKVNYRPEGLATTYVLPGETLLNVLGFDRTRFYVDIVVTAFYGLFMLVLSGVLMKLFVKEKR
jgi:ABC-type multidrug transport system permease subunit